MQRPWGHHKEARGLEQRAEGCRSWASEARGPDHGPFQVVVGLGFYSEQRSDGLDPEPHLLLCWVQTDESCGAQTRDGGSGMVARGWYLRLLRRNGPGDLLAAWGAERGFSGAGREQEEQGRGHQGLRLGC